MEVPSPQGTVPLTTSSLQNANAVRKVKGSLPPADRAATAAEARQAARVAGGTSAGSKNSVLTASGTTSSLSRGMPALAKTSTW